MTDLLFQIIELPPSHSHFSYGVGITLSPPLVLSTLYFYFKVLRTTFIPIKAHLSSMYIMLLQHGHLTGEYFVLNTI